MPPDAAKLAAYAVPTVPFGADAVVTIRGAGAMVRLKDFDAPAAAPSLAAPAASFTVAFTVNLAADVGAQETVPARLPQRDGEAADGQRILCAHVDRSEEHTSELQSLRHLVCRLL